MGLPTGTASIIGTHVLPIADLGLSATVTSTTAVTSTVFHTAYPATIIVVSKLTSGTGTLDVDRESTTTMDYSSPTTTLACSGTGRQVVVIDTTPTEMYVGFEQSSTSASTVWEELAIFVLYEMTAAEANGWRVSLASGINSVGATAGASDGSGVLSLLIV